MAREDCLPSVCLLYHSSHRFEVAEMAFMRSYQIYTQDIRTSLGNNLGRTETDSQIGGLMERAVLLVLGSKQLRTEECCLLGYEVV
jgi:hypothetical protein